MCTSLHTIHNRADARPTANVDCTTVGSNATRTTAQGAREWQVMLHIPGSITATMSADWLLQAVRSAHLLMLVIQTSSS